MILTCPECATSYYVDDARVPAGGRTVKCSSCGAKWTAAPDAPPPEAAAPSEPAPASAVGAEPDALDIVAEDPPPAEDPGPSAARMAARARAAAAAPPARRGGEGKVLVFGLAAGLIVALVAGLLVFRADVVRLWPASGPAFASVGLPVNPLGLVIEKVRADPTFQGGRPVLSVTGQIRNVREAAATAPGLNVRLLDRAGKPVAAKVAHPLDGRVPAGAVRHFAIAIVDPPANLHDLEVSFERVPRERPSARAASLSRAAEMRLAPAPVEAEPLPPGSPDALPPHD